MRPTVFVASSSEGLDIAFAIQHTLDHDAVVTVWDQGVFELSNVTIEDLEQAVSKFDFGIFVFSPDDLTKMRGNEYKSVRDNVLIEFGLFVGAIGRSRTFFVVPRGSEGPHIPTDLLGLKPATYDATRPDGNLRAALGPACNEIKQRIKKSGPRTSNIGSDPLTGFRANFRSVEWPSLLAGASSSVDIVVYYFDSWVNANYDVLVKFFQKDGTRLRVFVSDPKNANLITSIQRLFPDYSKTAIMEKIQLTGQRFASVVQEANCSFDRLEVYHFPYFINYSVVCIDQRYFVLSVFEMIRATRIDPPAFILDLTKGDSPANFWKKELTGLLSMSKRIRYRPAS